MIEKLKPTLKGFDDKPQMPTATEFLDKINELVDAVNELQESQNTYWTDIAEIKKELQTRAENVQPDAESRPENVQDKFAEQRKWIGKLCKFFDKEIGEKVWGILGGIDYSENEKYPYWCDQLQEQYQCCEPVKPDDDIIYKGA